MTKQGLRVSTRRTSVAGPRVLTRAAIARGSRSGGIAVLCVNPQPRKRNRQPKKRKRQPTEDAADEDAADEVRTPGCGSRDVVDHFDVPDVKDVQAVVPYVSEIYRYYRETEGRKHASPSYMSKHADINAKMRAILIDWLVDVHLKFKLLPETLYLTVNLIDRFLEKEHTIMRDKLQLVGVTAMFLACKYEEIFAPECIDFVYITAQVEWVTLTLTLTLTLTRTRTRTRTRTLKPEPEPYGEAYTRDDILRMEGLMLLRLNFQLTAPNAFVFLKRFAKVAGIATTPRSKTELLAHYLVELTLQEYKMLKYLPSTTCASAVYLALKTCGHTPWTADLERHSTYTEADLLQACVRDIHELHAKASTGLQAVRRKYAHKKYASVSSIAPADDFFLSLAF